MSKIIIGGNAFEVQGSLSMINGKWYDGTGQEIDMNNLAGLKEAKTINEIRPTLQITITNKGTRKATTDIAAYAVSFFKQQMFEVSNVISTISKQVRTVTFRATRVIGNVEHLDQL